jgi:uncharacterized protein (DUF2147 family)
MELRSACLAALAVLSAGAARAQSSPSSVYGKWMVQGGEGIVELSPCDDPARGPLCGRIVWLRDARNPDGSKTASVDDVTDVLNADPTLRQRKLLGMFGMYGFHYGPEPGSFEGGVVYDPQKGQTYRATVRLQPDGKLHLHGYMGFSALGRTATWSRAPERPER